VKFGLRDYRPRSGVPSALLVSAQRQLRVMGTDIVRTPGTLAGPYGDLETPVEPDGDAGVSEDTRRLRERIANTSKAVLPSLDELVGAVIGKRLEQVNEGLPVRARSRR
jgi:hypothetical protein